MTNCTTNDLIAAILNRAGWPGAGGDPSRASGPRLQQIARDCLRLDGYEHRAMPVDAVRAAFTSSVAAGVFNSAVQTAISRGWTLQRDTSDWASTSRVTNFHAVGRVNVEDDHRLRPLPPGGVAEHLSIDVQSVEEYRIARFARQFAIDEQDIVDDNAGLVTTIPNRLAQAAKRLRPDLVYFHILSNGNLADGTPLFDASRGNLVTSALDATSLGLACKFVRSHTSNGSIVDAEPTHLIVSPSIEETARQLLRNRQVDGAENLRLRVEPRFEVEFNDPTSADDDVTIQGVSGSWLLVAANGPTVEVGRRTDQPELRQTTLDRGTYGWAWDMSWDIGVKSLDWRGLYLSQPA